MAVIYGRQPDAVALAALEANLVKVVRWVDIYNSDNTTLWKSQVAVETGEVSIDSNRDERRNVDLILNDADGDLGYGPGNLWYDKIIKPYRGVQLPDTFENGYLYLPSSSNNFASITRAALSVYTHYEQAVRVSFDGLGTAQWMGGNSAGYFGFGITATNTLTFYVQNSAHTQVIGQTQSNASVPGIVPNVKVWLRAQVQISTAQLTYWYSYDDTNDYDSVTWIQLGTVVAGSGPGLTPETATTTSLYMGATITSSMKGRMYAFTERVSTAKTVEVDFTQKTTAATSFVALTGQTVNITSTAIATPAMLFGQTTIPGDQWVAGLGEFMIDKVDRSRFPKKLHVTGRDFTKKCLLSKFGLTTSLAATTKVSVCIKAIAGGAGITKFNFADPANTLSAAVTFDKGTDRWKAMKQLADAIAHELFFDMYGYLTLRPFVDPLTAPVSYTFRTGTQGNLVDFSKSTQDTFLKNHVYVVGDGPSNALVYGEASNTNVSSPTRIAVLGDRTDTITSATVANNTEANILALAILKVSGLEQFDLQHSSIVLPWLEAGSAVEVIDPDAAAIDPTRYLFTDFKIPLSLVPMTGTCKRVTIVG